ncbi:Transposase and inactivated derivatives [Trueperella pyogenes]|nr:transposase-like protein [Trueperella pyogenes]SUO86618.1 Transposase and inactivated derivatives [Trueperella pyogenes]
MTMTHEDFQPGSSSGREVFQRLVASGQLDGFFEAIDSGQVRLDGPDGFLHELVKAGLERGLQAELDEHLGYAKHEAAGRNSGNCRNGISKKTMASSVGDIDVDIPRDRAGTFTPKLVAKGQRRLDGFDGQIISLDAGG